MSVLTELLDVEISTLAGSYDDVAAEYYDTIHHPTCANFREASDILLNRWFEELPLSGRWICEVGPGRSAAAEQLLKRGASLKRLTLIDSSAPMLSYSGNLSQKGAHLLLSDANALSLGSGTFDLIVSSLGDPYNTPRFWRETYRVLRPGGQSFFTTPSYDWAIAFRDRVEDGDITAAQFDLSNGKRVSVPSLIYRWDQQQKLIEGEGLILNRVDHVSIGELSSKLLSPKLLADRSKDAVIVTGYVATKV